MRFFKMHGIGNDFIVVDATSACIADPASLAEKLCRRRFSIGADGLILVEKGRLAPWRMRIFNSDGSEPEMCGNGIRCAAKFLYDSGLCKDERMSIETLAGVMHITLTADAGTVQSVTVNMGAPEFSPGKIPVNAPENRFTVQLGGREVSFYCVSMGNPHAVTFDLFPQGDDLSRFGSHMENHPAFPKKANIEFCRIESPGSVHVQVWERGCGATLACGTGSCAVLAAGVQQGLLNRSAKIHLPGGTLHNFWHDDGCIYMTGPAETAYTGEIE